MRTVYTAADWTVLVKSPSLRMFEHGLTGARFGWTSNASIHWIVPAMAVACATMGIFSVYLAVFNYLADCYGPYASSAIAAQSFCRNLMGGAFPLFTEQVSEAMLRPK